MCTVRQKLVMMWTSTRVFQDRYIFVRNTQVLTETNPHLSGPRQTRFVRNRQVLTETNPHLSGPRQMRFVRCTQVLTETNQYLTVLRQMCFIRNPQMFHQKSTGVSSEIHRCCFRNIQVLTKTNQPAPKCSEMVVLRQKYAGSAETNQYPSVLRWMCFIKKKGVSSEIHRCFIRNPQVFHQKHTGVDPDQPIPECSETDVFHQKSTGFSSEIHRC